MVSEIVPSYVQHALGHVPNDWKICPLPDVVFFQEGPGLRKWQFRDSGVPFLNIRCIRNDGTIDLDKVQYISEEEANEKYSHFMLEPGDTVLSSSGTLGRVAVVREEDLPLMLNTSIIRFRSLSHARLDDRYMRFFLISPAFAKQFSFQSQGSAQANFGPTHLKKMFIALPPLPEQRKIGTILTSVDDAIEKTEAIIKQTEVVKQGLMQQLLTRGIGHTKFKKTEIGEIPAEWDVVQLDDIAPDDKPVVQTGPFGAQLRSEDFASSGIPVLNIGNVQYGKMSFDKLDFLPVEKAEPLQRYAVSEGDLLFSRMATVGRTCVVPAECNGWLISYHLMRLSVDKQKCNPYFLMYSFIGNASIVRQIEAASSGGTRAGVNTSLLKTLKFALPGVNEQNRIVSVLESLDKRIAIEEDHHQRLSTLKHGLMQLLLTGKIRIKVDEQVEAVVS